MSILSKSLLLSDLTSLDYNETVLKIKQKLMGRVDKAFLFGSFANKTYTHSSDIDLILIIETDINYINRSKLFIDIFDIYPKIDIFVYTNKEFCKILAQERGFGKRIKKTLRMILPKED